MGSNRSPSFVLVDRIAEREGFEDGSFSPTRNTCSGSMQPSEMTGEREQPGSNDEFNVCGHGICPRVPTRARPRAVEIVARGYGVGGYGTRRRPYVGSDDDPAGSDAVLQEAPPFVGGHAYRTSRPLARGRQARHLEHAVGHPRRRTVRGLSDRLAEHFAGLSAGPAPGGRRRYRAGRERHRAGGTGHSARALSPLFPDTRASAFCAMASLICRRRRAQCEAPSRRSGALGRLNGSRLLPVAERDHEHVGGT